VRLQAFRQPSGPTRLAAGYRVLTFGRLRDAHRFLDPGEVVHRSASFVVVARR